MTRDSCQRCKNATSIKAAALCLSPSGMVCRKDRDLVDFQLSRQKRSKSVGVTPSTFSHHHAGFSCAVRDIALAIVTLSSITPWIMHHASLYAHGLQIGPTCAPAGDSRMGIEHHPAVEARKLKSPSRRRGPFSFCRMCAGLGDDERTRQKS